MCKKINDIKSKKLEKIDVYSKINNKEVVEW